MAMTKIKTVGIDRETGLSRLAVTPKKKSRMKKIVPAIVATAALAAGVGAFGGTSASGGGGFFKSLKSLFGFGGKSAADVSTSATYMGDAYKTSPSVASVGSDSFSLGSIFDGVSKAASWTFGKIKGMDAMDLYIGGKALEVAGNLLSDDEDFSQQNFEAQLEFDYEELRIKQEIAMAELAAKNRANALSGTYMGFTSPTVANAEGVTTEQGYTPPRMPSPPTGGGGLLS
jgi:hypothetical protein